ncbi:hypothetical protein [Streptomyces sp. NBC_00829]|uniref:hypothetical protein n=1 Tax=Streptomyces sp. NBC_00829 TaxID=2903679 RepID=UPI00386D08A1|nr:hypothetical protein OG293_31535 [Streptomyces sp. NBC_00829]
MSRGALGRCGSAVDHLGVDDAAVLQLRRVGVLDCEQRVVQPLGESTEVYSLLLGCVAAVQAGDLDGDGSVLAVVMAVLPFQIPGVRTPSPVACGPR